MSSALERWRERCRAETGKGFTFAVSMAESTAAAAVIIAVGESRFAELLDAELLRFIAKAETDSRPDVSTDLSVALRWLREEMERE